MQYFAFKRTSCKLNSKDFRRVMTRATRKEQATTTLKRTDFFFLSFSFFFSSSTSFMCDWIGVAEISCLQRASFCSLLQLTSCYARLPSAEFICLRVAYLGGIEWAYMKKAFITAAIAVFRTCTVHVIFFHSLPSRVGCSIQGKLFSIFKLLSLVFVRYYLSSHTTLENYVLFVIALRSS